MLLIAPSNVALAQSPAKWHPLTFPPTSLMFSSSGTRTIRARTLCLVNKKKIFLFIDLQHAQLTGMSICNGKLDTWTVKHQSREQWNEFSTCEPLFVSSQSGSYLYSWLSHCLLLRSINPQTVISVTAAHIKWLCPMPLSSWPHH